MDQSYVHAPLADIGHDLHKPTRLLEIAFLGFGLTLVFLVISCVLGLYNVGMMVEDNRSVIHTQEVIMQLETLISDLKDAETGQRGYLLTQEKDYLRFYDIAVHEISAIIIETRTLIGDNPDQLEQLHLLEMDVQDKLQEMEQTIQLIDSGKHEEALMLVRTGSGKTFMRKVRAIISDMQGAEQKLLTERTKNSEKSYQTVRGTILVSTLFGVVLVSLVFYLSYRNDQQRRRGAIILAEQRERLRITLGSIGDAVISTDAQGRINFMNPVAEELTRWTNNQAYGVDLTRVFHIVNETTRLEVENPALRALREGIIVGLANHTILIARDGSEKPIDDSAAPIRDEKGNVVGGVLVFRDITEHKIAENMRRESEERFHTLVEQVKDYAIFVTDIDGLATSWNEGVKQVLGFEEKEFIGKYIVPQIFTPEDVVNGVAKAELDEAASSGRASDDRWMVRKDGTRFWAAGVTTGLYDIDRKLIGFMKVIRDQTNRKALEDELRKIAADLSEADRRKTEFIATLGHELRNPLAPIRTGLEVIKMAWDQPETVNEVRETMERQVQQMMRLIDDLLDISRITRGRLELRTCPVSLGDVIQSAVEATQPFIDDAGHKLKVSVPPEPIMLEADPNRLAQVFSNLLNNSAKYTPEGGHISLTAVKEGNEVVVTVKDNGLGIPLEMQDHIFEMFTQIDRPMEKVHTGLGIGLTLVKRLVTMHEGKVEVHSKGANQGSEFVVRLPIVKSSVVEEPVITETPLNNSRLRILVVDDNHAAATMLNLVIKMLGNDVRIAHDGVQAIKVAEEFLPDLVLMDLGMPNMNGYEAARYIREQPWGLRMILVALTGWGQDDDKKRTKDAGFDYHLTKPAEPSDLQKLFASVKSNRS